MRIKKYVKKRRKKPWILQRTPRQSHYHGTESTSAHRLSPTQSPRCRYACQLKRWLRKMEEGSVLRNYKRNSAMYMSGYLDPSVTSASVVVILVVLTVLTVLTILTVLVVLVVVVLLALTNGELGTIVLGTTLSNGHDYGLMVASTAQSTSSVETSWETVGNDCLELTVSVSIVVDTLEESKYFGIWSIIIC